jgi:hypothetical protein
MQRLILGFLTAAILLAAPGTVRADPLAPGATFPALTLADQHGEPATIDGETRLVLFTRDMDASKITKAALAENGEELLARGHAVYVSDVTGMPSMITSMFAIPAMKRRAYRMLLDREGTATADVPSEDGKVTVLRLDNRVITSVKYVDVEVMLRKALRAAAAGADTGAATTGTDDDASPAP